MRFAKCLLLACTALPATAVAAEDVDDAPGGDIVVTGELLESGAATKTEVPAIEVPQPVTVIPDDLFERMRSSAEQNGRSLNDEAIVAFERHVRYMMPDHDVIVAMIRAGRDAMSDFVLPRVER